MEKKKIKMILINPEQLGPAKETFTKVVFESYKESSLKDKAFNESLKKSL